jgi:hypothetical protein
MGNVLETGAAWLPYGSKDVLRYKHATSQQARQVIGEAIWNKAYRFTILRDPWEIVASWYRHCQVPANPDHCTPAWAGYQQRIASMSIEQFVADELAHLVPEGGFLEHYADDMGLEILTLKDAVDTLTLRTGHDPSLEIRPYAKADMHALSRDVRNRCWRDCEALGIEVMR